MTNIQTRNQIPRLVSQGRQMMPRPAATGPSAGINLTPKDIIRILRSRKWLILAFVAGFGILAGAANYFWMRTAPVYSTYALVEVNPPAETVLGASGLPGVDIQERYKLSSMRLVKSSPILDKVFADETMKRTIWFKRMYQFDPTLREARRKLTEDLQVASEADTFQIRIGLKVWTSDEKEIQELATIVNCVSKAFVTAANIYANEKQLNDLASIKAQFTQASDKRDKVQQALEERLRNSKYPDMRKESGRLGMEMQQLVVRSTELLVQQAQLAAAKSAIDKQDEQGLLDVNPTVMETIERDPMMQRFDSELKVTEAALARIQGTIGENHPEYIQYEVLRKTYEKRLAERKEELTKKAVQALRVGYEQQYVTITNSLVEVNDQLGLVETNEREVSGALAEVEHLTEDKKDLENSIDKLQARMQDLELVQHVLPVRMTRSAEIPMNVEWPKLRILLPVGIFLGAMLGIALSFLLALLDTSVKMPTDITRKVDLPLLALVPHADDLEEEIEEVRLACLAAPNSLWSESYRELRTNLLFSGPAEQHRTVLVTSSSPDDGRTTVAVNMAIAMASSGRRVLLVDANFRRPAISSLFPEAGQVGLSEVLSGQKQWAQCVQPVAAVPNLSVMVAGPLPPNPNELLGQELATRMLEEMGQQYDQVILDGPPLLLVSDASVLATQCDGTILVVRAGVNSYGIVARCRDNLNRIGAHVLGVVLNGVQSTAGGYFQKNYNAFYDYREQPQA